MKKKTLVILGILVALLVAAYVGINTYVDSFLNKVEEGEVIKEEQAEIHVEIKQEPKAHEVVNIMLVGADNLQREIGRENSYVEERSDAMKVVSLDYTDKDIKITSLDRDIVVWLPGSKQAFGRFNWAYSFGGPTLAIQTFNYNLDLDITKYVTFSFAGFINVIDKLGGLDINLTKAEADAFNGVGSTNAIMHSAVVEGVNHLDGYDSLTYARQRYLDSDFVRMDRQNIVIKAVIEKIKTLGYKELLDLVNTLLPYINTNLTNDEIKDYMFDVISFDLGDIQTYTYPKNGHDDVCINKDSMGGYILNSYTGQVEELHKFIYEVDSYTCSQNLIDAEKSIYDTYGEYYEGSPLIP